MIKDKIAKLLLLLFEENGYKVDDINVVLSNRPDLCDYQCNDIFKISKEMHNSPLEIGKKLMDNIPKKLNESFKKIEFVAPGFINITLSDQFINEHLRYIFSSKKFGIKDPEIVETYIIDYGGPNVAKPLHVGHMRTAIVGESIKRIINFMGHNIIGDTHLGDYGLQIGQVIYGLKEEGINIKNISINDLNRIYPRISALCKEDEQIKDICATITKDMQDGNDEYQEYFKKILEVSKKDIKKLYDYLDVHFDLWNGESDAYPFLPAVEKLLADKKLVYESMGALVVDVAEANDKKEIPPLLFKKSNGAYLYASTDLATIYDRVNTYNPDHILYVVDNRQGMHFEQVFRASSKIGLLDYNKLEFLGYGTINGEDNKPYKTRNGDAPSLEDLFNQTKDIFISKKEENKNMSDEDVKKIVNAILKFADLINSRERDYIFDLNKFSDVVGKTGPYILYTYLRMNKIINELKIDVQDLNDTIYNEVDRNLRLKLLEVDSAINTAFIERKPSYIADYVYNLCVCANAFYQTNHIMNLEDKEKQENWLYLLKLMNKVIKAQLYLLAVDIPSKM